jgi:predicted small secreted protein
MRKGDRTLGVTLILVAAALLVAACDDGGAGGDATATMSPAVTQLPSGTPATATPAPDIRQEDLGAQPGLTEFIDAAGGQVAVERIEYADITDDGVDDAVVPVSSGGEGGDIGVFVYGYAAGGLQELLRVLPQQTQSIVATIEEGQLVTTEGVYSPGDPLSFPSQLLHRYYTWDGNALVVEREEQESAR